MASYFTDTGVITSTSRHGDDSYYSRLPELVLSIDKSVHFCAVVDRLGYIVARGYRKGLEPVLTEDETRRQALLAAIRHSTRLSWEDKIGKVEYSLTRYRQLIRATIPTQDNHLLLVSFDDATDNVDKLIIEKLLPAIKNYRSLAERG